MPRHGKIINGTKYVHLHNNNEFKKKSLEDNIYFTLRDIFLNISDIHQCLRANEFNYKLTNHIRFEERTDAFQYANVLQNKEYVSELIKWLDCIKKYSFDFDDEDDNKDDEDDNKDDEPLENYIKYDDWWVQFDELKNLLNYHNKNM